MSDSVRPHRRQPTRLRHPWDSPGKNTGVGCHFLFQCMRVKSESEVTQSCPTLSNPMDCSPPGSSIHGNFQARVLEWGAIAEAIYQHIDIYISTVPQEKPLSLTSFPSSVHESEKWKWSHSVVSDSSKPCGLQPTRLLHPWDFPGKSTGVGCHCLLWHHMYKRFIMN